MFRITKALGFVTGIVLGVITRDNYLYPYPLRVSDLEEDFNKYNKEMDKKEAELKITIKEMDKKLEKAQGIYVTKKHKQY